MYKKKNNRETGTRYEKIAGACLEEKGCRILEYNYRCKCGEIDIIAEDGEYLVFCEVKYRGSDRKGHPSEAVDYAKQRVISKSALYYITVHHMEDRPCRFDVISCEGIPEVELLKESSDMSGLEIIHYENAFDYIE